MTKISREKVAREEKVQLYRIESHRNASNRILTKKRTLTFAAKIAKESVL